MRCRQYGWLRATGADLHPPQAIGAEVHPAPAGGPPARPAKPRSKPWGPRRLAAAGLKLATRLLYGAQFSDVAASPKAFSTELLRNLDLQCERFEFGPEVTAKLCRVGERIVGVPIHYERKGNPRLVAQRAICRRTTEAAGRGPGQRPVAKKHRWTDGPRAFGTLWRWRHWTPQTPDPDKIPAAAPAAEAGPARGSMGREAVPAAIETDIDHWAEEDASRSAFEEALWKVSRQRPAEATTAGSGEVGSAASSSDARSKAFSAAAALRAAAAAFEPRLMWELFVRKPAGTATAPEPDEDDLSDDWQKWGLTDLLLLLAIVNLGLGLFLTCVPLPSTWPGYFWRAWLRWSPLRTTRAGRLSLDKYNRALGILAILLGSLMLPGPWLWRDRALMLIAAVPLLAGLRRLRKHGIEKPERNLLDLIGALALFFAGFRVVSPPLRIVELVVMVLTVTVFLPIQWPRMRGRLSDNILLYLTVIGIFLLVVLASGFPINLWNIPWTMQWLIFRYAVLPHWTEIWWFRWGIVAVLVAAVGALLYYRKRWNLD